MSSNPPSDRTSVLLRAFLEREAQGYEARANQMREIANSVSTISGKIIEHDTLIAGLRRDVNGLAEDQKSVADDTGRHNLAALRHEIDSKEEIIQKNKTNKSYWKRWAVGAFVAALVLFTNTCATIYLTHHYAQAAVKNLVTPEK